MKRLLSHVALGCESFTSGYTIGAIMLRSVNQQHCGAYAVACAVGGQGGPHLAGSCPALAAARGVRAPCTPGPGLRPWEPRFDAVVWAASSAHAYGENGAGSDRWVLAHNEGMCPRLDPIPASIAGGLGARCAPSGEHEGRSPLAVVASSSVGTGSAAGILWVLCPTAFSWL
jgi:hypothetical protein